MGDSHPSIRISVHQALGGDSVADLLLWRKRCGAALLLGSSTVFWFLFERAGYNFLSFVANVHLLLVVILFLWAKSASLLNRPLPPLPNLEISEASALKAADALQIWVNSALSIAHDISVGKNLRLLIQACFLLWIVSFVGNFFNFLTLVYLGVIVSLSVPVLYEKYQDHIDNKLSVTHRVIQTQYRKIAGAMDKEKKIQ